MTEASGRLAGVRVLVTRPAHQAEPLCRLIEAEGGTAIRLPLFAIEPSAGLAEAQRRLAAGHDLWIFTSANAVRHALPLKGAVAPRIAAIGPATAAALAGAGLTANVIPITGASSEALLELPELTAVAGARVLVVTGEGGLNTLVPALTARGAQAERAEVYRRVPLPYPPDTVLAALRRTDVIVTISAEALERLLKLVPEDQHKALLRKPLVLPSARVVDRARELGFTQPPRVAEPLSDATMCAACVPPLSPGPSPGP